MFAPRLVVLIPLLVFCIVSRVPAFRASVDLDVGWYLWNFSPLLALVLFSSTIYRNGLVLVAPLVAYLLGDVAVWIASGDIAKAFYPGSIFTYAGLAAILGCGLWLRRRERTWARIATASLGGAIAFFLISNFGSWALDPLMPRPTGYDRSLWGLAQSYLAAIPFFRGDLASMFIFTGLFFSPAGMAVLTRPSESKASTPVETSQELAREVA